MKTLLPFTILIVATLGCSDKHKPKEGKSFVKTTQEKTDIFNEVSDFPIIKDSAQFIADLRKIFKLKVDESPVQKANEKITTFKKVNIHGSDNDYYFIEYNYGTGDMASYPWKYQLLLRADGSLVKSLSATRFDFVTIFPNQNPFLLTVIATAKGNGGHEIYKISSDTLENVYEGYYNNDVQTYDAHQDLSVFNPYELNIVYKDENKDGFNDIIFTGQRLMLGKYTKDGLWYDVENGKPFSVKNPAERIAIKYIFLYDKQTGHFKRNTTNINHCVYSDDASKLCKCPVQFELKDSLKLTHIKDQFYKSNTGHLYERTTGQKELNGSLTDYEYFNGYISQEVDPLTFEPLEGWYAKDKKHVYYYRPVSGGMQISKMDKADCMTFKLLEGHYKYAKDKNFFYEESEIIEGFIPGKTNLKPDSKGRIIEMTCKNKTFKFELVN